MFYIFSKSTIDAGGSRQRAFNVEQFLRAAGYEVTLVVSPIYRTDLSRSKARMEYLKTIFSLRNRDVVLLQNPIFSTYFIILICIVKIVFRPTFIFDFDDATWVQNPIAPRVLAFFSDKFIVASHYLAKWKSIQGKPILRMPNLVDYELAEQCVREVKSQRENNSGKVVMGWIGGGPDSMQNLSLLKPVFIKLAGKKLPCVFKLVGALGSQELKDFFISTGFPCKFVDALEWGKRGEIQKANASLDVGLCPLIQNESNEGRCSLKVLDYMAAGIPVVISPVGENNYFIQDGVEGFLPKSEDEWVEKIELLINNADLRKKMGQRGAERIKKEYSYQSRIHDYVNFLDF